MTCQEESGLKRLAWCIIIGCAMASFQLETILPLVIGVMAILLGRYTTHYLGRR